VGIAYAWIHFRYNPGCQVPEGGTQEPVYEWLDEESPSAETPEEDGTASRIRYRINRDSHFELLGQLYNL